MRAAPARMAIRLRLTASSRRREVASSPPIRPRLRMRVLVTPQVEDATSSYAAALPRHDFAAKITAVSFEGPCMPRKGVENAKISLIIPLSL